MSEGFSDLRSFFALFFCIECRKLWIIYKNDMENLLKFMTEND